MARLSLGLRLSLHMLGVLLLQEPQGLQPNMVGPRVGVREARGEEGELHLGVGGLLGGGADGAVGALVLGGLRGASGLGGRLAELGGVRWGLARIRLGERRQERQRQG